MSAFLDWLADEDEEVRGKLVNALSQRERNEFHYHWEMHARPSQLAPEGDWRTWLILAGRGFGKTRAGAEWVRSIAETEPEARIALVSSSLAEARAVMIEGESGIIACSPPDRRPRFESSLRRLSFPNGAQAQIFSASEPEGLRGPQHSHAWCDKLGKWALSNDRATKAWDNLILGMRLGATPRTLVTTTPRVVPALQRLLKNEGSHGTVVTRGSTYDNAANLPARFLDTIQEEYAGSQLARQEIAGELLQDLEGALWNRALLEEARVTEWPTNFRRVVVAVDPPASATGDECGIVVAAIDEHQTAYVLADCSLGCAQPHDWAGRAADAAQHWEADKVVAEANQGGDMVESVLRAGNSLLPVKLVRASRGKVARAEPIASLYNSGRVRHCGYFPQLEDQMCSLLIGGGYAGPGRSPDRADALVWALTELLLSNSLKPRIRQV